MGACPHDLKRRFAHMPRPGFSRQGGNGVDAGRNRRTSASTQNPASIVFDSCQASILRLALLSLSKGHDGDQIEQAPAHDRLTDSRRHCAAIDRCWCVGSICDRPCATLIDRRPSQKNSCADLRFPLHQQWPDLGVQLLDFRRAGSLGRLVVAIEQAGHAFYRPPLPRPEHPVADAVFRRQFGQGQFTPAGLHRHLRFELRVVALSRRLPSRPFLTSG